VVESTQGLPGGVLLTKTGATYKWSYPNRHGDLIFATDNTGTMIGGRTTFDPFGNQIGAVAPVDNSTGSWDYGWHGTAQRPLESQAGITPIIEMGARQYTSLLGRFLETDPIEGGTPNDYMYPGDPINSSDLGGTFAAGLCGTLKYGLYWLVATVQTCFFIDDAGRTLFTIGGGGGVGGNNGASIEGVASSVHHVAQLLGISACASASLPGVLSGSACVFRANGHWYSSWSFGGGTRGIGVDLSIMYASVLPSWLRGAAMWLFRRTGCDLTSARKLSKCRL